jgi:hypothetical protein
MDPMKRMIWQLPLVAALAIACGTTQKPTQDPPPATAMVGSEAPSFDLAWINRDGESSLADLRGRVLLLEFWRTW